MLEELLDPNGADEGEEGQRQGWKDGNERDDKAGRSLACAMKTLEAGSELAWDVERLVHGRVPGVAKRLRELGTKRRTAEERRAATTVPSLMLQAARHRGAAASAGFETGGSHPKNIVEIPGWKERMSSW
jgi:hypothetical protein